MISGSFQGFVSGLFLVGLFGYHGVITYSVAAGSDFFC